MNVFDISKRMNVLSYSFLFLLFVITAASVMAQLNFDNYTPKNYVGVVIDGDNKEFRRLYIEDKPTINAESSKFIVVDYVNRILNYNSSNYYKNILDNEILFSKKYYKSFKNNMEEKIKLDIENGYHITTSIVSENPYFIGISYDGSNFYYRYSLITSTIYKSELRELALNHNVIVVIKVEDPKDNINGLSISSIGIY